MADIVFCTNSNYANHIPTLLESIIHNVSEPCRFFIVYSSIHENTKKKIEKTCHDKDCAHEIVYVYFDSESQLKAHWKEELKSFRGGFDTYSRLFLPQLLKDYHVEKCLYLDIDVIVQWNLKELFELVNKTELISGVLDTVSINTQLNFANSHYINAGVLLMNLKGLEAFNFTEKCISFIFGNYDRLQCHDQDAISNVLSEKEITLIDQKFNEYLPHKKHVENAVIIHFTGPQKPWMETTRWRYKKLCWYHYHLMNVLKLRGFSNYKSISDTIFFVMCRLRIFLNLSLSIKKALGLLKS